MKNVLTEKQEALLNFIEQYQMENGGSPTIREMKEYFGVSSDNSILKLLKALEEKGKIEKEVGHRGIKLLSNVRERLESASLRLPLLGSVPAGVPVDAIENVDTWMSVGEDFVLPGKTSFLLNVTGESMLFAGIRDGDIAVVCADLEPRSGDVVVALVDGQSTVKTYTVRDGAVILKAENPEYEDIYPENELCVQGVVTGTFRYYKR
jgi:repressor LexA